MEKVIISNPENFEEIKQKIISGGAENFHVLADFDRTLTKASVDNKIHSTIAILRNENYLSEEYSKKAFALADYYHPIEFNPEIPLEEKKKHMQEWWKKHFDLLFEYGLNKNHLKRLIDEERIKFREGALEFFDLLHEKGIPLVIISSSPVGDLIEISLKKYGKLCDNVKIVTNLYKWDKDGNAIGVNEPIIHVFNKDETILKDLPEIYNEVKDRKNVLLLGDSLGDLGMIEGFDYDNLLKVGFLNYDVDANLERYKNNFDVVIRNDSDMNFVNEFVKEIK